MCREFSWDLVEIFSEAIVSHPTSAPTPVLRLVPVVAVLLAASASCAACTTERTLSWVHCSSAVC